MEVIGIVSAIIAAIIAPGVYIGITASIAYTVFKFLTKNR